ncbi:MAG: ThiF family adenylyltransferase [Candidatus Parvarchaeota archaeon]|nr:ThiF family adenylyltransferase [Candidatus Parvarchaeota archaeon]MCW1301981.1 ThiF family adenylyltransferase [Candidatus Parvarchaeota archaeon]
MENEQAGLKIVVVGCGALGSAILQILGRLGIGTITMVDGDIVTPKNIGTQTLYDLRDASGINYKSDVAKLKLEDINHSTVFKSLPFYLTGENAEETLKGGDLVIDATDNSKSRLLINETCVRLGIPLLEVMAKADEAMVHLVHGDNACFNCLHSASRLVDNSCVSIDPALSSIAAGAAVNMALGFLIGKDYSLKTALISARTLSIERVNIKRLDTCEVCSKRVFKGEEGGHFLQICGDGIKYSFSKKIVLHDIYLRLSSYGEVEGDNNYILLKNGSKSVLISSYGDLLFTGYDIDEAKRFLEGTAPLFLSP